MPGDITLGQTLHTATESPLGVTSAGALHVSNASSEVSAVFTFHNAATATGNGSALTVGGYKNLTVDIDRTATSATILFYGTGPGGTKRAIMGVRLADLVTGASTTGAAETWMFNISGLTLVEMRVNAIVAGGGSVTVKGRAVA